MNRLAPVTLLSDAAVQETAHELTLEDKEEAEQGDDEQRARYDERPLCARFARLFQGVQPDRDRAISNRFDGVYRNMYSASMGGDRRDLIPIASALDDLRAFPEGAKDVMGQALLDAQYGDKHPAAKPLHGFGGAGVLEIVEDDDGNTYRAIYTVRLRSGIYLLHAFQKKARRGIKTDQHDISLVKRRLNAAIAEDARRMKVRRPL